MKLPLCTFNYITIAEFHLFSACSCSFTASIAITENACLLGTIIVHHKVVFAELANMHYDCKIFENKCLPPGHWFIIWVYSFQHPDSLLALI